MMAHILRRIEDLRKGVQKAFDDLPMTMARSEAQLIELIGLGM
jgi:hypothetical protein